MKAKLVYKGGSGSGNFGHEGRPGEVGGSGGGTGMSFNSQGEFETFVKDTVKKGWHKGEFVAKSVDSRTVYSVTHDNSKFELRFISMHYDGKDSRTGSYRADKSWDYHGIELSSDDYHAPVFGKRVNRLVKSSDVIDKIASIAHDWFGIDGVNSASFI